MRITLDVDDARELYEGIVSGEISPRSRRALGHELSKLERPELRYRVRPDFEGTDLLGFGLDELDLDEISRLSRWAALGTAAAAMRLVLSRDVSAVAGVDRIGAYLAEVYDGFGISVRDEDVLYVVLVTTALLVELARNGHQRGDVDLDTLKGIGGISKAVFAALLPYLPPAVRDV